MIPILLSARQHRIEILRKARRTRPLCAQAFLLIVLAQLFLSAPLPFTSSAVAQSVGDAHRTRILIKPASRVKIRSDIPAKIIALPFTEGQSFKKGDILLKLDCRQYQAAQAASAASRQAAEVEYRSKKRLLRYRAVGKEEVALAKANFEKAKAEFEARNLRLEGCIITAPFNGSVSEQRLHLHEYATPDQILMSIIRNEGLELEMIIPSRWLNWLQPGFGFSFDVDETGQSLVGSIKRLGAEVDPVSQTIKAIGRFENQPDNVLPGMSGTAHFDRQS